MSLRTAGFMTLIVAILGAGAWWFTLRDNQLQQINQLTHDELTAQTQANARLAREAEANQKLLELQAELDTTQGALEDLESRIPDEIEFTPLMLLINSLTDQHLLRHDGITETSRQQLTDSVYTVTYTLITTGSFDDQMRFISELHDQPRLLVVRSVNMTSREGATPNEPMITLNMNLQTFTRGALPAPEEEEE